MKNIMVNILTVSLMLTLTACQKELGYTGFVDQDAVSQASVSLATDKAVYNPGETVTFTANSIPSGAIYVRYRHLDAVLEDNVTLSGNTWNWTVPDEDFKGYMAEVYQRTAEGENILATIAVDVSSDWSRFPRYGFLSTFTEMSAEACDDVISGLSRMHINGVQFQDWHWKHHWPLAQDKSTMVPLDTYIDIASRTTKMETVRNYISSIHSRGMKAIFYNLCFGALDDAAEDGVKEEWYLFKDTGHQTRDVHELGAPFKSSIYLVNPGNSQWQDYLGERNDDVYENLGFDGYQIDQLGSRGTLYDYDGNAVDIAEGYASFISAMKDRHPGKDLVMNAVSSYGAQQILGTGKTEFAYNEVWDSESQFSHLKQIIESNEQYGGAGVKTVFAAYMNYDKADNIGTFNTPGVLLTDAVIFALGGSHLEMGEHMLGKEYFPNNNLGMTTELEDAIIVYYDFMTAYQNLLRDGGTFNDVTVTSADGKMSLKNWEPQTGNVVTLGKEFEDCQVIHFLNFSQANSTSWRDKDGSMPEPVTISDAAVNVQLPAGKTVKSVWMASPDIEYGAVREFQVMQNGNSLSVTLPSLKYWDMLVICYEN